MRVYITIICLAVSLPVLADSEMDAAYGMIYTTSLMAPAMAEACEKRIPDYRNKFDTVFARWKEARSKEISHGKSLLQEEDRKHGGDHVQEFKAKTEGALREFNNRPESEVSAQCENTLQALRVDG